MFNAMTGTRDALVADLPGLTRDRQYGFARRTEVPCIVVDTGGLVEDADVIESLMIAQTERAISEADRRWGETQKRGIAMCLDKVEDGFGPVQPGMMRLSVFIPMPGNGRQLICRTV